MTDPFTNALLAEADLKRTAIEAILNAMTHGIEPDMPAAQKLEIANAAYSLINRLTD